MTEHVSPWPERRPQLTEDERHAFAERLAAHLPKPEADGTVISDADLAAMKAAFVKRFNEQLPRTETLFAVARIGYRMALRDYGIASTQHKPEHVSSCPVLNSPHMCSGGVPVFHDSALEAYQLGRSDEANGF